MHLFVSCAEILGKAQVDTISIKGRTFSLFLSSRQIQDAVRQIAERMNRDLAGKDVVFVVVLKGAFVFAADLLRRIAFPLQVSFMRITSYEGISSTGKVRTMMGVQEDITGRDVVLIEDIVDTGLSLKRILKHLQRQGAGQIKIATLFLKPDSFKGTDELDYIGLRIPNRFVVGYGLDYMGYGRNLKDLYVLEEG